MVRIEEGEIAEHWVPLDKLSVLVQRGTTQIPFNARSLLYSSLFFQFPLKHVKYYVLT
jgi:hypothetical protein